MEVEGSVNTNQASLHIITYQIFDPPTKKIASDWRDLISSRSTMRINFDFTFNLRLRSSQ